jgi:hypothetical protein
LGETKASAGQTALGGDEPTGLQDTPRSGQVAFKVSF